MAGIADNLLLVKTILSNPQLVKVNPSINLFLTRYMQKFDMVNIDGRLVLHSHLPPINSPAFSRFINEHLLARSQGPTHAQIGITNACPQNCEYCYNKSRIGPTMNTDTIKEVVKNLKNMGVIWLGLTGGEPLFNKDIAEIVNTIGDSCAVKLFTGGYNLTRELASDLKRAGLDYVSVSLDHWQEGEQDKIRGCNGSFHTALKAIEIFQETGGIHVGVSTVLSKSMLNDSHLDKFMQFLIQLGVHEAWLSEVKPAIPPLWNKETIITAEERNYLMRVQERYNKERKITVNYLGHFEGGEYFGCNAGHKMIYIDAFGEVGPCVFAPMTFGNVRDESVQHIFEEMKQHFRAHDCCFVNSNYPLFAKYYKGSLPLGNEDSVQIAKEAQFGQIPEFFRLYYR